MRDSMLPTDERTGGCSGRPGTTPGRESCCLSARGRVLLAFFVLFLAAVSAVVPHIGLAAAASPPQRVAELVKAAEVAYENGEYEEAIRAYRMVLESGWTSSALYYNLGCACYRVGMAGWSVAYLEEARRLAPRDPEIRHNLRIVSAGVRDRLSEEESSWILDALTGALDAYAPADAVRALVALFWGGALALAARQLLRRRARVWATRALALLAILAVLVSTGLLLKAYQIHSAPSGVVVAEEIAVLSGPREGETAQFALHAGTLLYLGRTAGEWREVWLSAEMRGWVPAESITQLRSPRWIP